MGVQEARCLQWHSVSSCLPKPWRAALAANKRSRRALCRSGASPEAWRPSKVIAQVLCVGLDCDLALLTVEDAAFWRGLPSVEFNWDLPQLQDEVTVAGFPIGGDNTCVTVGVVSRIDMQAYNTWWSKALLAIQIDAAINPGNSGGPCFVGKDH